MLFDDFLERKEIFMKIHSFKRTALYYETDQMGIIHHSNYIRWFEEARIDFLNQVGFNYNELEKRGVMIPVLSASCQYKGFVKFDDEVEIVLQVAEFAGARFKITYTVSDTKTEELRTIGETAHCFTDRNLRPIRVKRDYKDIYDIFNSFLGRNSLDVEF